jgi:serine protease Do
MKSILRPYITIALAILVSASLGARAQSTGFAQFLEKIDPLLSHTSQGYLGVMVSDVDNDSATKLKLKEVRGALITLIDHDAPAGQVGLHVNDVVLELNGQKIESAEQFGRMLHEMPAGRKIAMLLSRDGAPQTIEVQLCDRKAMEQDVWNKLRQQGDGPNPAPALGIFNGSSEPGTPGFHMPFFGSTLNVGAVVEPLTGQMADFLGIQTGILVKQVTRKSEAAAAGLKSHDVILKVGTDSISTTADWDRALRANQNKPVQVTILRDGKQQVVNLQVDSKHNKSEVDYQDIFPGLLPDGPCPLLAELDSSWAADAQAAADQLRAQAEEFQKNFNPGDFKIDPKEVEKFRLQMEQFRKEFNSESFKIDQKQMEDLKRQMEEFRKSMPELLNKQMEQLRRDMDQLRLGLTQHV